MTSGSGGIEGDKLNKVIEHVKAVLGNTKAADAMISMLREAYKMGFEDGYEDGYTQGIDRPEEE